LGLEVPEGALKELTPILGRDHTTRQSQLFTPPIVTLNLLSETSDNPKRDALIVFAHGSRVAEANQSVEALAESAARSGGFSQRRAAFLELAEPSLSEAVAQLAAEGAEQIFVMPYFLVMGVHLRQDLPKLLTEAATRTPGVELIVTEPLGGHPDLAGIVVERTVEARRRSRSGPAVQSPHC